MSAGTNGNEPRPEPQRVNLDIMRMANELLTHAKLAEKKLKTQPNVAEEQRAELMQAASATLLALNMILNEIQQLKQGVGILLQRSGVPVFNRSKGGIITGGG